MKHLTTSLRSMTTLLLLFVMIGVSTAWAQINRYAERNGVGGSPCVIEAPCDLPTALTAAGGSDMVLVRVRESGAMTRLDEDVDFDATIIGIYDEDNEDVTSGLIAIEGDATIRGKLTVQGGTTLYLQGDVDVTSPADSLLGAVTLGGSGSLTLTLTTCGQTSGYIAQNLTVMDDVEVDAAAGCTGGLNIAESLTVKDGSTLDMGSARLRIEPMAMTINGGVSIDAGSSIEGSEHLELRPQAAGVAEGVAGNPKADAASFTVTWAADDTDPAPSAYTSCDNGEDYEYDPKVEDNLIFYSPSEDPLCSQTLRPNIDIGVVVKYTAAVAEVLGDDPDTEDETEDDFVTTAAVEGSITVIPFSVSQGFANNAGACYEIAGGGSLELDILKEMQGGACIDVAEVGDGGTSINRAGGLFFTGTTQFDGRFRNHGNARTEFWELQTLSEGLEINGVEPGVDPADDANIAGAIGSTSIPMADCLEGENAHGRTAGVFIYSAARIVGDVILTGTDPAGTTCREGLHFSGDADPSTGNGETDLDKKGTIMSSVLGAFESTGSSYVYLGDHNRFHNVAFEDDVISDGMAMFDLATPATYMKMADNLCGIDDVGGRGNAIVFAGDLDQDVRTTADAGLSLAAVRVMKTGDGEVLLDRGTLTVDSLLAIDSGKFTTDGNLSIGEMGALSLGGGGSLSKGEGDVAYLEGPDTIHYTGTADITTGDEIMPPAGDSEEATALTSLEVSVSGTVTLGQPVTIEEHLFLANGMLNTGGEALTLNRGVIVHHGSGDIVDADNSVVFPGGANYDPATEGLTMAYKAGSRTAGNAFRSAATAEMAPMHVSNVVIDGSHCKTDPEIMLNAGFSRVDGNILVTKGALDLAGQHLVVFAAEGASQEITVAAGGYICDSGAGLGCASGAAQRETDVIESIVDGLRAIRTNDDARVRTELQRNLASMKQSWSQASKSASRTPGLLHFAGNGDTKVSLATGGERRDLPAVIVKRKLDDEKASGTVTIESSNSVPAGVGSNTKKYLDMVGLLALTVQHGNVAVDATFDSTTVEVLHVASMLLQEGGSIALHAEAANLNTDERPIPQSLIVGGPGVEGMHMQMGGDLMANGGEVHAYGAFMLGQEAVEDAAGAVTTLPSSGRFDLGGGTHVVTGDFSVAADVAPGDQNRYIHGDGCAGDRAEDASASTMVGGDYSFFGTGECEEDEQYASAQQGLSGDVTFLGSEMQSVMHAADPDAYFGSVTVQSLSAEGAGGIVLGGPVVQNMYGTLTLRRGLVDTVDETFMWTMYNTGIETDLAGQNSSSVGTVMLGSRDSYVNGPIARAVGEGNAGGGVVTGGYLFPVGSANSDSTASRMVDSFRPLILQFPDDLGATRVATVDYVQQLSADLVQWPEDGMVVDGVGGSTLTLDALADQFWLVVFNQIPAHDPNIRVAAEGLPNVFDAKGLRLVQWDCDLTNLLMPPSNPRLAGIYDLEDDETDTDDNSFAGNDRINGVLNLTQEGVEVGMCNIIGVASNFLQNPINIPQVSSGFAKVQYIQNVADTPVDVYVDGNRVGNDWAFQSATQFANVVGGEHTIEVVAASDPDNSNPIASMTESFKDEGNYNVIVHGDGSEVSLKVVDGVRMGAMDENSVEFYVVHGARELGPVDIRIINPIDNSEVLELLANNIDWDDVGEYITLAPGGYNFEITTANNDRQIDVFRLRLQQFRQQTFVLNLSGSGKSSAEGVTMMGVEQDGSTFFPDVITSVDAGEELPDEFALHGNYPNPFNPATRIQIDLPETAEVTIQIIDMLGRNVMTLPAREMEAGSKRAVEVNAVNLASGTYLYKVIAKSASGVNIDTGRMVLVK